MTPTAPHTARSARARLRAPGFFGRAASLSARAWRVLWAVPVLAGALGLLALVPVRAAALQAEREAQQSLDEARAALQAQQLDRAELLLERALMLMPELAEARVEFALLMARRGQPAAARQLLQALVDDPQTPPEHREALRRLAQQIADAAAPPGAQTLPSSPGAHTAAPTGPAAPRWRAEWSLSLARNPLARAEGDIVLTLPDGPIRVPLARPSEPGQVWGVALTQQRADGGLELSAQQVQGVSGPGLRPALRAAFWGLLPWTAPGLPAPLEWGVQAQQGFDGLQRYVAAVSTGGATTRWTLAGYGEARPSDHGWLVRAERAARWAPGWLAHASAEHSRSTAGPQGHWRAGLTVEWAWRPHTRLQAQGLWQQDRHPYSPLLDYGARRWTALQAVALEQRWPIDAHMSWTVRAFAGVRQSNIELFAYRDAGLQAAFSRDLR